MKIFYVTDALAIWGGVERIIIDKANYLAEQYGYDVYILTANQGSHPIPYPLSPLVTHHDLSIRFHLQYQYKGVRRLMERIRLNRLFEEKLKEYIEKVQPDVIISVYGGYNHAISKLNRATPFIFESHVSCHSQVFSSASFFRKLKEYHQNKRVKAARMVVALTSGDAEEWKKFCPQVSVIPNIVSLNISGRYCDYFSKSVIFVGRFSMQKDIGSLLQIWHIVNQRHPDWKLHIYAGYGGEMTQLKSIIEQEKTNVILHEPTADILEKYKESSMLLMTSKFEPFGLVMPEAMSCGLPVVAFDCPYGPAEIITDGEDGFLIKNRDIHAFADKVCRLIENPPLRKEMGKQAIISSQRFSPEKIMPMWKQLFESMVSHS